MDAQDIDKGSPGGPPGALAERETKLPRLLSPRQVGFRSLGVVAAVTLGWLATGMTWLSYGLLLGVFAWIFWRRHHIHRTLTNTERAHQLLDLGKFDEAAQLLDEQLGSWVTPPHLRPFAAYYRAIISVRRGAFKQARARLQDVIESEWLDNRQSLQSLAPVVYASSMFVAVLDGDLASAERWRSDGQRCAANLERHWFVPDLFMLARRNEWAELLQKLESNRDAIEGTLSGVDIRRLQLIEAYAVARLGEREDNYRGHHSGREVSTLLAGIWPGRFDYLATRWPELREFMLTHHLLAPE